MSPEKKLDPEQLRHVERLFGKHGESVDGHTYKLQLTEDNEEQVAVVTDSSVVGSKTVINAVNTLVEGVGVFGKRRKKKRERVIEPFPGEITEDLEINELFGGVKNISAIRAKNSLIRAGLRTTGDILEILDKEGGMEDLILGTRNFGEKSLNVLMDRLDR